MSTPAAPGGEPMPQPDGTDARIAAQIEKLDIHEGFWDEDDCHELNALLAIMLTALRDSRAECSRLRATLDAREAESTSFQGFVAGYMAGQSMADRLIMGEAIRVEAMEEASKYVASRAAASLSEEPNP